MAAYFSPELNRWIEEGELEDSILEAVGITELDRITPTSGDLLYAVDDPDGTPVSKAATVLALANAISLLMTAMNVGGGTVDPTVGLTLRSPGNGDFEGIKILSLNQAVSLLIGRSGISAANGMLLTAPFVFFSGYQQMVEVSEPSAPAANGVRIYAEDNGSGKTRIMALFSSGAAQQIAIQP